MTDADYSDEELDLLASLRALQPEDARLHAPPEAVWAGIERGVEDGPAAASAGEPRRRRHLWVGVAAAAALIVGIGSAIVIGGRDATTVIARADLSSDGLAGAPAGLRGDAEVVESGSVEAIHVDVGDLRPASGEYLEVWLIKPDVSGMVSLGTVRADGAYELPQGLRLADYPIVDVSTEPYDGNPSHSGLSLLRGVLDTGQTNVSEPA